MRGALHVPPEIAPPHDREKRRENQNGRDAARDVFFLYLGAGHPNPPFTPQLTKQIHDVTGQVVRIVG